MSNEYITEGVAVPPSQSKESLHEFLADASTSIRWGVANLIDPKLCKRGLSSFVEHTVGYSLEKAKRKKKGKKGKKAASTSTFSEADTRLILRTFGRAGKR